MTGAATIRLVGGPTALITYGGLRILTDPTFDPPGDYPRPGTAVVLHKLAPPAVALEEVLPVDLVLLSHDHHSDNLDRSGRAMLGDAAHVLTTQAGAERLGPSVHAVGMSPGETFTHGAVTVTAVEALHGPPEVAAKNGPVIGFVLCAAGEPTVYVSGDNALVSVVERVAASYGPFDAVVLFIGGACVPEAWGEGVLLTLDAARAVEAAQVLDPAPIVPIHQDSWAHFTSHTSDVEAAFMAAGMTDRLRPIALGQTIPLA
jgi:L-ascorbate metabolism protein UlaG (beta-lactamase superfamily)